MNFLYWFFIYLKLRQHPTYAQNEVDILFLLLKFRDGKNKSSGHDKRTNEYVVCEHFSRIKKWLKHETTLLR